jgi:phenylpropionate dioxygenase-like ring-hydroxylating dioxygenase large terminal subunit
MWTNQEDAVRKVWKHCVGFDGVEDTRSFINYIERCQITNSLLFNGSTDQPLAEQLKGLYLKQRFGEFAANNQGLSAADLKAAFRAFLAEVELDNLARPTWAPGADTLDAVLVS